MVELIHGGELDLRENTCNNKRNVCYVDENFFKNWTPEMAYVLGFFAADGCLTVNHKRGNKYIEFTSTDYDIIEKIKTALKSDHKIGIRLGKKNCKTAYRLQIGSKEIFDDLIALGFTPTKSLVMKFPIIPTRYLAHFVRGYFDGDGHSNFCRFYRKDRLTYGKFLQSGFTSGSKIFLEKLQLILKENINLKLGTLYSHSGFRLNYSSKDSKKLFDFIYKDCSNTIYLARKYLKFKNEIEKFWGCSSVG